MMSNEIVNLNNVQFDEKDVPTFYQWSGYSKDVGEFKKYNFLRVINGEKSIFICSSENGVGLGDYLSNYIFNQQFIYDMENVFSPGYDYWFLQAWEKGDPQYDELDYWVQEIVEFLIHKGLIVQIKKNATSYFIFSDLCSFEETPLPNELIEEIEVICRKNLWQHFEDNVDSDSYDVFDCTIQNEAGEWAYSLFQAYIKEHPELN